MSRLIGKTFDSYTPESFHEFAKKLTRISGNKSKEVTGIAISQKAGKTSVRFTRTEKSLNRDELSNLQYFIAFCACDFGLFSPVTHDIAFVAAYFLTFTTGAGAQTATATSTAVSG